MANIPIENEEPDEAEEITEAVVAEDPYPWAKDADEERRCWIFERMANSEISGNILVENMQKVNVWIKDETVSTGEQSKRNRTGLKSVE